MEKLLIKGSEKLVGSVEISSSKNATLPLLAATLLSKGTITFENIPGLNDIKTLLKVLSQLGVKVEKKIKNNQESYSLNASNIEHFEATYDLVKTMRASVLVLGPLLARFGHAKVSLPGGCAIGARPIDIHLMGLKEMGAQVTIEGGYVQVSCEKLQGACIVLPNPSVGATENLMMAATLARGVTIIKNAALEPEIVDLAHFLRSQGAFIKGDGTSTITIEGIKEKEFDKDITYRPISDRIEAATYLMAGAITNSPITLTNVRSDHLDAVFDTLQRMGHNFCVEGSTVYYYGYDSEKGFKGVSVDTSPYPGFPTDAQAQLVALCTQANSPSVITEHIFENRFMHVPEINRMGANIQLRGASAFIPGNTALTGAPVMCTDLRASAALVLAALCAEGESEILRIYHLKRGYDQLVEKFTSLKAMIAVENE